MVNELFHSIFHTVESHAQGIARMHGLQRVSYRPTLDFMTVGVHNQCKVTMGVRAVVRPNGDICDVADPQLIDAIRNEGIHEIGIERQPVGGVGRPGAAFFLADFKAVAVKELLERIAPYAIHVGELRLIHKPELTRPDAGVEFAHATYVFECKRLAGYLPYRPLLISLVIGLLAGTKQSAHSFDRIFSRRACMQTRYCLVPAFFLICMLKFFSAMLIISSYRSARRDASSIARSNRAIFSSGVSFAAGADVDLPRSDTADSVAGAT